ncbi:MAG: formate dehydrogenase accessory protein FdhE [Candidatus Zhuqueibacterota bacterium]
MTIAAQINYLKKHGQFFDEYLTFYQEILTLQESIRISINTERLEAFARTSDPRTRLQRGEPLIVKKNLYIEPRIATSFFNALLTIFKQYPQQFPAETIETLHQTEINDKHLPIELVQHYLSENTEYFIQLSEQLKIESSLLVFIAKTTSLPFIEAYLDLFKPYLADVNKTWEQSLCPFCGSIPAMARLEKESGQRHLWCAVCHTEWTFVRNRCPYCDYENLEQNRYFFEEHDSLYRVYVCDQCKRYLKTIDENKYRFVEKINLSLEDMITQYLDEIAVAEGYQSPLRWSNMDFQSHHDNQGEKDQTDRPM